MIQWDYHTPDACTCLFFQETERWLYLYFSGKQPDFISAYAMLHLTAFRQEVMELLKLEGIL